MSEYNDGSSYGYDTISPYDQIPLSFESVILPSEKKILAAYNEYPILQNTKITQLPLSEQTASKKIETPSGMIEGFRPSIKLDKNDIQLIILFLLIVVCVLQAKMMMTMDFLLKSQFSIHVIPPH
jgi:hypothetical protein